MKNNRNKQKKLITAVATAFIITASATPLLSDKVEAAAVANFKDVPAGAFYEKAVQTLSEKGVIGGYGDGIFKPGKSVTRAEAAKMLAFDLGLTTAELNSNFKDVKNGDWYYQPVTALSQAGGISGYENGTFQPNKTITRAEMASMLVKAYSLQANASAEKVPFNDVASSSWYASAVQMLYGNKITSGKSANKFAPNDPVTRGEIAAFIHKVNEAKVNKDVDADTTSTIEKINEDGSTITISGTTYKIPTTLNGILNTSNSAILANAKMNFEENGGVISKITYLQLNTNGQPSEATEFAKNLVLDGKGNTINGTIEVNANYITLKNLTINGNLEITPKLANDFYSEKIIVKGQTLVNGGDNNTVVFNHATLGTMNINKKDVRIEAKGNSSIQLLTATSNATVLADENTKIAKLTLEQGADSYQLEGPIGIVEVKNKQLTTLTGNAKINEMHLNNGVNISISFKNKIGKVSAETGAKFSIGSTTTIGELILPNGMSASDFITNYVNTKTNIEKINGESNPDFKAPSTLSGGGGSGGTPTGNKPTADSILNKYKPTFDEIKSNAEKDFNNLKQQVKNGEVGLSDAYTKAKSLYNQHESDFTEKYGKLVDELKQNSYSENEAKTVKDQFDSLVGPYGEYLK